MINLRLDYALYNSCNHFLGPPGKAQEGLGSLHFLQNDVEREVFRH